MKSHLEAFLHNPLIKDILKQDETPDPPQGPPSNTLDLKKIQDTLSQLVKAVETLKSALLRSSGLKVRHALITL